MMRKLKVSELKPGMSFDQPVYIDPTNVLVQAKQELGARDIERLVKWGIREVETNGVLISEGSAAAPSVAMPSAPTKADAPIGGSLSEEDRIKIASDYEQMRKNKIPFRTMMKEAAELLKTNMQALMDGKPFDNHAVLSMAGDMVDELSSKKYLMLALYGLRMTSSWPVHHAVHAGCYGVVLGLAVGYSRPKLQELMFSMLLMDVGMGKVPLHVREKAGQLSAQEWTSIKKHPLLGYQLLTKTAKVKATLANVALQHQESFDGTGYPQALRAGQIEEPARVAAIADSYSAMIEKRPHREALLPYDAMKNMLSVQMNKFDPRLLRTFLGQLSIYPLGSLVELSNKRLGLVIGCRANKPLRPLLRLMRDENGLPFNGLVFSDLTVETDVYIIKALDAATAGIELDSEI